MWYEKSIIAGDYIKKRIEDTLDFYITPVVAIVLGSALGSFADRIKTPAEIPYSEIPGFTASTVHGHAGKLVYGFIGDKPILCMQGRTHIYEGNSPAQVVLPVRTFRVLGIKNLILTNAAGAINTDFRVGDFMIIDDHLSFFLESPLTGTNEEQFGLRFPSMDKAYNTELRRIAKESAIKAGIDVHNGVYAYMKGPQFETPAEIRALGILGADAVGMSTVPETIAAVHCGVKVLGISCLSNMAAGISEKELSHEDVNDVEGIISLKFGNWMEEIICQL